MSRRTKVFLAYARGDASDLVGKVRAYLEPGGTDAWVDVVDIPAGDDWRLKVETSIRDSDALVLIMTPKALESPHVAEEVRIAQELQKRIVPLAIGDVMPPEWLRRQEYIRFQQFDDAVALGKLSGDLKNVWESVEQQLQHLRFNVVTDDLAPLLDHLETLPKSVPRPIVRPEVVMACAEIAERMSQAAPARHVVDLIADWHAAAFEPDPWHWRAAYEKNARRVRMILTEGFKHVKLPQVKIVPFVLVVMTANEAEELKRETVFQASYTGLLENYRNVLGRLTREGIVDWAARYGDRPEDWRPFEAGPGGASLAQLINAELSHEAGQELRRPAFIDIRKLNDQPDDLKELRETGCIVIIDAVSVCHPDLLTEYRRSLLDVFPSTFLLKMAPFDPVPVFGKDPAHVMTLPWVQRTDSFFFDRLERDKRCGLAGQDWVFKKFINEKVVGMFLQEYAGVRNYIRGKRGTP